MPARRSGFTTKVRRDGLAVVRPRGLGFAEWLKGVLVAAILFTTYKALVLANVGPAGFEDRIASLMAGTPAEAAVGWMLQADPVTRWLAQGLFPIF